MKTLPAAVILFAALPAHPASAADSNAFANCLLVPFASFSSVATTTVGLNSRSDGTVRWSFFDGDGRRLEGGSFAVQQNRFSSFILSEQVPSTRGGEVGFLLFCLDDDDDDRLIEDEPGLAGNAFFFEPDSNDAVFLPTVPVFTSDLDSAALANGLAGLTDSPLDGFSAGATTGEEVHLRYFTDSIAGGGDSSVLCIFATDAVGASLTVQAVGPAGEQTLSLALDRARFNVIDAETITGIDSTGLIGSGVLIFDVPDGVKHLFAFSIARSSAFRAAQTLLANSGIGD